jgi:2,3-dihydroxyphenylpropionate 1,2-dioxygenase
MTPEQRQARQVAVMEAAREFAEGQGPLQPLNPDWDRAFLELIDSNRLPEVDAWSNAWIEREAGHSAHEIRTWIAASAALATHGRYTTQHRFYREAPELIAGFAIRTAVLDG